MAGPVLLKHNPCCVKVLVAMHACSDVYSGSGECVCVL